MGKVLCSIGNLCLVLATCPHLFMLPKPPTIHSPNPPESEKQNHAPGNVFKPAFAWKHPSFIFMAQPPPPKFLSRLISPAVSSQNGTPKPASLTKKQLIGDVLLSHPPNPAPLPTESTPSHYYPARETDAQLVRVCDALGDEHSQFEKFLFYRGLGSPKLPINVSLVDETIHFTYEGLGASPKFIIFDRAGDTMGLELVEPNKAKTQSEIRPKRNQSIDDALATLKTQLIANGLFEKEADAMIKTWRDTWFEDGLRVFVILPRQQTDAMLPITINPTPKTLERVIVARIEVLTPEQELAVTKAVQTLKTANPSDLPALRDAFFTKHGHFGEALILRLLNQSPDSEERAILNHLLQQQTSP